MPIVVQDRRVRRSKALISHAFTELVLEKDYGQVTVQDIIDRADIGRSTFYAHFRDKESVLLSCFDEVEAALASMSSRTSAPAAASTPPRVLLDHAWDHQRVYRAICASSASGIVQRHLRRILLPVLDRFLPSAGKSDETAIAREFYLSAVIGVLIWWVSTDFRVAPADVADEIQRLAASGLWQEAGTDPLLTR